MLLPAGVFREPLSNVRRADIYCEVLKEKKKNCHVVEKEDWWRKLTRIGIDCNYTFHKYENNMLDIMGNLRIDEPCIAFCGIAKPASFIQIVKKYTNLNKEILFENHAKYDTKKYEQLKKINVNNLSFVTTYKDFVKLNKTFKSAYTIYVLELNLIINDNALLNRIENLVNEN